MFPSRPDAGMISIYVTLFFFFSPFFFALLTSVPVGASVDDAVCEEATWFPSPQHWRVAHAEHTAARLAQTGPVTSIPSCANTYSKVHPAGISPLRLHFSPSLYKMIYYICRAICRTGV